MKKIKRFVSILLAAMMLLCCTCAQGEVQESDLWDIWIENTGYGTLTIFSDGTAIMNYYDGTVTECEWAVTEEGAKFTTGQWWNSPMELLDENTLSVADGWMTFTREGADLPPEELNPIPVGEEGAAYFGTWALDVIDFEGTTLHAEEFGMILELVFNQDGTVMSIEDGESNASVWAVEDGSAVVEGSRLTINEEGRLVMEEDGAMMIFNKTADAEPSAAELTPVPVGEEGAAFLGLWTLDTIAMDGESYSAAMFGMSMTLEFNQDGTVVSTEADESFTSVWAVENGAAVTDGVALTINENDQLVLNEDEAEMIFIRGESAQETELSEEEQLLALLALMGEMMSEEITDLPEHLQGYVGQWHMVYTATGGLTGDLRTMGVTCTLTLNADGTGSIDFPSAEESTWYDDEGVVRFGESGMPMTLLEGGFLQYGTELGGYMIFSQDAEAVFDTSLLPSAQAAAPQAPASTVPDVTFTSNEEYLNKKFVATTCTMMGQLQDASVLGAEYSLFFRENGTCDFVMAGMALPNLTWGLGQVSLGLKQVEAFAINYYGTMFNAIPTPTGFDMDYYGTMTLHFTLAE